MIGAESLLRTLLANGVDVCFMNPGTSEMQFVSALDRVPAMRGVLCLFEGVCSGAADGYARMLGRPAATLLHLGPGLANGLANFHNARKARSPVVSIVGEHSTRHIPYDAPLTADIGAFARTVSGWVRTLDAADRMGEAASAAVAAAVRPPGQVATLIIPADHSWSEAGPAGPAVERPARRAPAGGAIAESLRLLRSGGRVGMLLGGSALLEPGLAAAGRIAAASGIPVFANRYAARLSRGRGRFRARRLAYFPEQAEGMLEGLDHLVLVEAQPPVSFFGYEGRRSCVAPEACAFHILAREEEDGTAALEAAAGELGAQPFTAEPRAAPAPPEDGPLDADGIGRVMAALLPAGAVISEEAVSCGAAICPHLDLAAPHEHLPVTGGAIGQCLPVALGAAIACPGRKVVAVEADGSGLYTMQALWTMARERLDVVTVILANRRYRILDVEMRRTGAATVGPRANDMIDIGRPCLDWVKLSEGMGVPATRAATAAGFAAQFGEAMSRPGPRLIEAVID